MSKKLKNILLQNFETGKGNGAWDPDTLGSFRSRMPLSPSKDADTSQNAVANSPYQRPRSAASVSAPKDAKLQRLGSAHNSDGLTTLLDGPRDWARDQIPT